MKYLVTYNIGGLSGEAKVMAEFCANKGFVEVILTREWADQLGVDPGPYDKIIPCAGDPTLATAEAVLDIFEEIAAAVPTGRVNDQDRAEKLNNLLEKLIGQK